VPVRRRRRIHVRRRIHMRRRIHVVLFESVRECVQA